MKKFVAATAVTLGMSLAGAVFADENRVEHFKGLPAPDLATAVANFSEYNNRLEAVLKSELTNESYAEVHMLTYTLENALERISEELEELAETLEEVHLASESFERDRLVNNAKQYLETSRTLIK